jgi:hypothetical protein
VAGRYRALLIGNSSYPADEHNLQTLKGPVKDIAVLNRALVDGATGMFADTEVALLPEASSTRAIRAMGRFFGESDRDDVLLFYFSGHGKLDQAGRLHLCMQDTESTDLLSTAVSSVRINEFADASHARNAVIVLDCCFSGAFRGGDAPDAIAGPGRYVLTSCRRAQLANDATVENSTSYFTQHLVDALLGAAVDHDGDGYVTFSELYAYVDRRLRESGKQIPQQRVAGDGDLRLARRPQPPGQDLVLAPVPDVTLAEPTRPQAPAGPQAPARPRVSADATVIASEGGPSRPTGPPGFAARRRIGRPRRSLLVTAVVAAAAGAGITVGAIALTNGGAVDLGPHGVVSTQTYNATAPWRLTVNGDSVGAGCSLALVDAKSGTEVEDLTSDGVVFGQSTFQVSHLGSFRWRVSDARCQAFPQAGMDLKTLPFSFDQSGPGDSASFVAPPEISIRVNQWHGDDSCQLRLVDPVSGTLIQIVTLVKAQGGVATADTEGYKYAYLSAYSCGVSVSTVG